jgi:hypothetical protein
MDTNKIIQQSEFLAKYFEVKDSKLTCRKDAFFGLSNDKIYEKCVLIYADLKNEINNEEILTTFRDATVDFIKSINYVRNVHSSILDVDGEEVLIQSEDFPTNYVNMSHPDDYKRFDNIIQVSSIYNHGGSRHNRVISRLSWKIGNKYVPMSFICDTGATKHIYLSKLAYSIISTANRIIEDPDLGTKYVTINGRKAAVLPTPDNYEPANLLGLPMLIRLGLSLSEQAVKFLDAPEYF